MSRPEYRIPEDKTQEVFTLAAQLYAQHNQSYSVKELMEAGAEAKIPPEFIQQAIEELQLTSTQQSVPTVQTKRSKYLLGLAIGLPLLAAIGVAGWLLARNAATNAQVQQAPIQPVQPILDQPPLSDTNLGGGNFKCTDYPNLKRQDLIGKNLRNADCTRAALAGKDLSNLNLEVANLSRANLKNANLRGTNLRTADLTGADLTGADLSGANLEGANLSNTVLEKTNLSNGNLTNADLAGAKLEGANLIGAKKEGAKFNGTQGNYAR